MSQRRGGTISFKVGGEVFDAKGSFTYSLGGEKKEGIVGSDSKIHGYKTTTMVPFIEGAITDRANLDHKRLTEIDDETVTLELANGKVVALYNAWYAGDAQGTTEEGELPVRFEGKRAEEI